MGKRGLQSMAYVKGKFNGKGCFFEVDDGAQRTYVQTEKMFGMSCVWRPPSTEWAGGAPLLSYHCSTRSNTWLDHCAEF